MRRKLLVCQAVLFTSASIAAALEPAPTAPATKPAAESKAGTFQLRVLELKGRAYRGAADADPKLADGWTLLHVGDVLGRGHQLRTTLRSTVKLVLEPATPPTIILIDRASLISIDDLERGRDAEGMDSVITRLGLAYGTIRAGVAEGEVRSDMVIQSPVATLAKRGTWGFSFFVERGTGRFEINLADRGMVEAIQMISGLKMTIMPGQMVDQLMSRWVESARFSRPVNVQDLNGFKGTELSFLIGNESGLGVLSPAGDPIAIGIFGGRETQNFLSGINLQGLGAGFSLQNVFKNGLTSVHGFNLPILPNLTDFLRFIPRRLGEGDFGVGTGSLPRFSTQIGTPSAKVNALRGTARGRR